jgi:hypothetical protein
MNHRGTQSTVKRYNRSVIHCGFCMSTGPEPQAHGGGVVPYAAAITMIVSEMIGRGFFSRAALESNGSAGRKEIWSHH